MISQPLFNEILPIHFDKVIRTKEEFLEATKSNSNGPYLIDGEIEFTKASEIGMLSGYRGIYSEGKSLLVFSERAKITINISEPFSEPEFSPINYGLFSGFSRIISLYPIDSSDGFSSGVVNIVEFHPQEAFSIFIKCRNIYGVSVGIPPGSGTLSENTICFNECHSLTDCYGYVNSIKNSVIFRGCRYLSNCLVYSTDSSSSHGFVDCIQVGLSCACYDHYDYSKGRMENCITYVQKGLTLKVYGGLEQN